MSINNNNKNNSTEIIAKSSFQERGLEEEDNYPDPSTLPLPSREPRIVEDVTLSELIPGRYVSTTAKVVYLRAIEKQDALGSKMIFSGILEDSTFKIPFVSHRIPYPLIRNCVYKFQSAYVHEFPSERSLLLVITEYTKISPKDIEDFREYIWKPTIESIKRPVKSVALQGVITTVHSNSGLIKRCNKCKSKILRLTDSYYPFFYILPRNEYDGTYLFHVLSQQTIVKKVGWEENKSTNLFEEYSKKKLRDS